MAGFTALVVGCIGWLPEQLIDKSWLGDKFRSGPDFTADASLVFLDDEGRSMATKDDAASNVGLVRAVTQPGCVVSDECLAGLRRAGAVNVDELSIRIDLRGRRNQEIRIVNIRPIIEERSQPWAGTLFGCQSQGGNPTMRMIVDLDKPSPVFGEVDDSRGPQNLKVGRPFFARNWISLKDAESQELVLRARTAEHYVAFHLEVEYRIGDETKKVTINDHGNPFRVTAQNLIKRDHVYSYQSAFILDNYMAYVPYSGDPSRIPA